MKSRDRFRMQSLFEFLNLWNGEYTRWNLTRACECMDHRECLAGCLYFVDRSEQSADDGDTLLVQNRNVIVRILFAYKEAVLHKVRFPSLDKQQNAKYDDENPPSTLLYFYVNSNITATQHCEIWYSSTHRCRQGDTRK